MTINGLHRILNPYVSDGHVAEFRGKVVAVDASVLMMRGAYSCAAELCKGVPTDAYVTFCMEKAELLLKCGVTPFFVFDGSALPAKAGKLQERVAGRRKKLEEALAAEQAGDENAARNAFAQAYKRTPVMDRALQHALTESGVGWMVAPFEADAQLAFLARNGLVAAVMTEDGDLVAHGCPVVLFKFGKPENKRGDEYDAGYVKVMRIAELLPAGTLPWANAWDAAERAAAAGGAGGAGGSGVSGSIIVSSSSAQPPYASLVARIRHPRAITGAAAASPPGHPNGWPSPPPTNPGSKVNIVADMSFEGYTYDRLREMCVIAGSDYSKGIPGVASIRAHKLMAEFRCCIKAIARHFAGGNRSKKPAGLDEETMCALFMFKHAWVFNPVTEQVGPLEPLPQRLEQCPPSFLGTRREGACARGLARGLIHPHTLQPYGDAAAELSAGGATARA